MEVNSLLLQFQKSTDWYNPALCGSRYSYRIGVFLIEN